MEQNILTKEGLKNLKAEQKNLIEIERPKVIEEIKEARAQGDLSENAEFDAARQKQGEIEDRILEIDGILENTKIVTSASSSTKVRVGSVVTIQDLKKNEKETYTIVGTLEANPFESKISNQSPLAMALLGFEKGATVKVLAKTKYDVKIVSIKNP